MATGGGNMDSRGVLRGQCDSPGCSCRQYAFSDSGRCVQCHHPPAKHLKAGSNTGSGQFHTPQQHVRQVQYVPAPVYTPLVNSGPLLNDCPAIGCNRKVHYDQELGPFDYCSPECRNRDLLPRERERLRKDIETNKTNMVTSLPESSPPPSSRASSRASSSASSASYTPSSKASNSSTSTLSGKVNSCVTATNLDGKKKVMVTIEKLPKEPLGIITAEIPGETGFRIVGIQLNTPAHHALKDGHIKFLDVITQLNEDDIESKEWFEHSTKSKTRPLITILRNQNTASGIKHFLNKVEKFPVTTHVRMAMNPTQIGAVDFGIEPLKTTTGKGQTTGYFLGVNDKAGYTAHMSGITIRDQVILYATMNSKQITEGRVPLSEISFKDDIEKAMKDEKHLVFMLKNYPMDH